MMRWLWGMLILLGIAGGALLGDPQALTQAALESAAEAAGLCLSMMGAYCLWMGLLQIAQEAGMVRALARVFARPLSFLFRGLRRGGEAMSLVALNLMANMLGMGNAATPLGIRAMAALQRENPTPARASDDMCLLLILNTASVQLLPLSVIALRAAAGSAAPEEIILPAFLATLATAAFGTALARLCAARGR